MTKAMAKKQIHGMRLVAPKSVIAKAIEDARRGKPTRWTVLRNRTPEVYAALTDALSESR